MSFANASISILGTVGRDPEMRYTPSGTAVTTFPVAVNTWRKSGDEGKEVTAWYRVSVFGKQAESVNQYVMKGSSVLVEGNLDFDEATGGPRVFVRKDGTSGASFEIRANTVRWQFKNKADSNGDAQKQAVEEQLPF